MNLTHSHQIGLLPPHIDINSKKNNLKFKYKEIILNFYLI